MENTEAMEATMQTEQEVKDSSEEAVGEETPQAETELTEAEEEKAPAEQGIRVRFNHQDRELTQEEAVTYAQKGMKYDNIAPMLDNLSYLADNSSCVLPVASPYVAK